MTKRAVLAGLLGGVAMFVWMSVAHVVLPLGETGVQEIANEPPVLTAMHAALLKRFERYTEGTVLADDVTLVVLEYGSR